MWRIISRYGTYFATCYDEETAARSAAFYAEKYSCAMEIVPSYRDKQPNRY